MIVAQAASPGQALCECTWQPCGQGLGWEPRQPPSPFPFSPSLQE